MPNRTSPVQYTLKMNGYIMRLDQHNFSMENELIIDLIMVSLLNSFAQFVAQL